MGEPSSRLAYYFNRDLKTVFNVLNDDIHPKGNVKNQLVNTPLKIVNEIKCYIDACLNAG